ncbi:MAG: type II toxin-antitoxin system RelE/ParE family toxin [Flavobacterium sp.]|nr:type II toxin-antitoxin system RelE/ParE family toxin [Flavobacterium sp.]
METKPLFTIKIDIEAITDIEDAAEWYNEQSANLGNRFKQQVKKQVDLLAIQALNYGIRYANVRCMLIYKFPFLVHYIIDEANNTVQIFAVLHTSRHPKIWLQRKNKP